MHHRTSACTAAAAAAYAMQVAVPVCGVCVFMHSSAVIWIEWNGFFSGQGNGLFDSISWLDLAASVLVRKDVTRMKLGWEGLCGLSGREEYDLAK
jgi:hypothetical protein